MQHASGAHRRDGTTDGKDAVIITAQARCTARDLHSSVTVTKLPWILFFRRIRVTSHGLVAVVGVASERPAHLLGDLARCWRDAGVRGCRVSSEELVGQAGDDREDSMPVASDTDCGWWVTSPRETGRLRPAIAQHDTMCGAVLSPLCKTCGSGCFRRPPFRLIRRRVVGV